MQVVDELNRLAAAFIGLQRSVQGSSFEVVRSLQHHINMIIMPARTEDALQSTGLPPAGPAPPEKPQWLFRLAQSVTSTDERTHCRAWTPPMPLKRQRCGRWRRLRRLSRSASARTLPQGGPPTGRRSPSGCSGARCARRASWRPAPRRCRARWRSTASAAHTTCRWNSPGPSGALCRCMLAAELEISRACETLCSCTRMLWACCTSRSKISSN